MTSGPEGVGVSASSGGDGRQRDRIGTRNASCFLDGWMDKLTPKTRVHVCDQRWAVRVEVGDHLGISAHVSKLSKS